MSKKEKPITAQSLDKLLKFLPIFEQEGYKFSNWHFPEPAQDGTIDFPHCDYSKEVDEFERTLRCAFSIFVKKSIEIYFRGIIILVSLEARANIDNN